MDNQTCINDLAGKISFQVLTGPCRNSVANELSRNATGTPMNVKIKLRHKNDGVSADIFSVSKTSRPDITNRIRLVSSDQTITSFNLIMQSDGIHGTKKPSKKQNKIFNLFSPGVCLGTRSDDNDYSYMPSVVQNYDQRSEFKTHENIGKELFGLKKNYAASESLDNTGRQQKMSMGKCKPGGCLDPPFDEDKYTYEFTKVRQLADREEEEHSRQKSIIRSQSLNKNDTSKLYLRSIGMQRDLSQENCIKTDSLITYPSILACDEPRSRNSSDKGSLDNTHKNIKADLQPENVNESQAPYYIPAKIKEKNLLGKRENNQGSIQQSDNVVQHSNKIISSMSRDSILPLIGGPIAPVLPDSIQLSIIESDEQAQNINTYHKKPDQQISSYGDVVSIATEKISTSNLAKIIDTKTKEIGKLSYLDSLNSNDVNTLPNIETKAAEPIDKDMGNKDIIVIAPIKTSTDKRHPSYSNSEKNLNINVPSSITMDNSQERPSMPLPSENKTFTKTENSKLPENKMSLTSTHEFGPSLGDTNDINQNENSFDSENHYISEQKHNTELKSNSLLSNSVYNAHINETVSSPSEINNILLSKEQLSDNDEKIPPKTIKKWIKQDTKIENLNLSLETDIDKNASIEIEENKELLLNLDQTPNDLIQMQSKETLRQNVYEAKTKPLYTKETRNKSEQSLPETKQSSMLQSLSPYSIKDEVKSKVTRPDEKETNYTIAYDKASILPGSVYETLQSDLVYSPLSASEEKLTSLKQLSDQNINIAPEIPDKLMKQDEEDRELIPTKLNEQFNIYSQDVETHKSTESDEISNLKNTSTMSCNAQLIYNDSPSDKYLYDNVMNVTPNDGTSVTIDDHSKFPSENQRQKELHKTPEDLKNKFHENTDPIQTDFPDTPDDTIPNLKAKIEEIQFNNIHKPNGIYQHNDSIIADTKHNKPDSISNEFFEISNSLKTTNDHKIYVDVAMNIQEDENNNKILKSYDSKNIPESVNASRFVIKSTIGINEDKIRIPIDPITDFVLLVDKTNITIDEKREQGRSFASKGSFIRETKYDKGTPNPYSKITQKMFEETISSIYEHNLVPLENMIKALNEDIKVLAQNQKVIQQMLKRNKNKTSKVLMGNRKCGCYRGLLM